MQFDVRSPVGRPAFFQVWIFGTSNGDNDKLLGSERTLVRPDIEQCQQPRTGMRCRTDLTIRSEVDPQSVLDRLSNRRSRGVEIVKVEMLRHDFIRNIIDGLFFVRDIDRMKR